MSYQDTLDTFRKNGIVGSPLDNQYNPLHGPNVYHMGDFNFTCSLHVTVDVNNGQGGQPTTGSVHFDGFNPTY